MHAHSHTFDLVNFVFFLFFVTTLFYELFRFIRMIAPPGIGWFDMSGTNKVIRFSGKANRFADEKISDLEQYSLK